MKAREQMRAARRWLVTLSLSPLDAEGHVLRLFGVCAALTLDADAPARDELQHLVRLLPPFSWSRYTGDPLVLLATRRLVRQRHVDHPSFVAAYEGWRGLLRGAGARSAAGVALACRLVDRAAPRGVVEVPSLRSLVEGERGRALALCRHIATTTAFGTRPWRGPRAVADVLPSLCCSYARDWDLGAACILARACAYLGRVDALGCQGVLEWLLAQQRSDGHMAWEPATERLSHEGRRSDLVPTVDTIWTFAEAHRPGFILRGARMRIGSANVAQGRSGHRQRRCDKLQ